MHVNGTFMWRRGEGRKEMNQAMSHVIMVFLLFLLLGSGLHVYAAETDSEVHSLTVFAAASTTETMGMVAQAFGKAHALTVICSFGSSSLLAKQIEQGAPADVFLAADQQWMDYLEARTAIVKNSRFDLLSNQLVMIAPRGKQVVIIPEKGFAIASAFSGRIALGDPSHVPAGVYAKEAFVSLGWWDALADRLAPAADVRSALKLVELDEVDVGVVYATDAKASTKVSVMCTIPTTLHRPILYPIALTATAKPAAADFLAYLHTPEASMVFTAAGFTVPAAMKNPHK